MMIWKIMRGFLAALGFLVLALAVMGAWGLYNSTPKLPPHFVLDMTLNGTPADTPPADNFLAAMFDMEPRLSGVTDMIVQAGADARVEALVVRLGDGVYDWANVQELRDAIAAFRATGKRAYVFADSYGGMYPGMAEYYLATAFDEIWLQPIGDVGITGFYAESPYVKGLLDRMGVQAQMFQSGEYKTGPESLLRTNMSDAQREMLRGILSSQMTDFFGAVAQSRDLDPAHIGVLIDGAPYTTREALSRKLVDHVGYKNDMLRAVKGAHDRAQATVDMETYAGALPQVKPSKKGKSVGVAMVHINGMIVPQDIYGGLMSDPIAAADDIARQIEDATQDDAISAIVLRVVSPGGSPAASETIRHAVETAKEAGKLVVVSMGAVAASGGYWVSVDADRIFALDGTITGSIGVFGGKMDLSGLWEKLDVTWDGVKMGANAGMWSSNAPFDTDGALAAERMIDVIDEAFIERVAKGRGFAVDVVKPLAGGRVWTGRQAKTHGLIDEIGGLHDALDYVAGHLGVASRNDLDIWSMHSGRDPFKVVGGMFRGVQVFIAPYVRTWAMVQNPNLSSVYLPIMR